jgi:succinoglycan biosynthesis transport protein ExoP
MRHPVGNVSDRDLSAPGSGEVDGAAASAGPGAGQMMAAGPAIPVGMGMGVHGHHPMAASAPSSDGLFRILRRRWSTLVSVMITTVLLAIVYLLVASPVYTGLATLLVEPAGPQLMAPGNDGVSSGGGGQISQDFLATECDVVTSSPVLALAMTRLAELPTFRGSDRPIDILKAGLTADVSKKGQTLDVTFQSRYKRDVVPVVTAVVDAYQTFEASNWKSKVKESFDLLEQGKTKQRQELEQKTQRMRELASQYGISTDVDPDKSPIRQQMLSLSEALTKAHLETITAKNAFDSAAQAVVGHPDKIAAVTAAEAQGAYSANPAASLTSLQNELLREQALLNDAQRDYLPSHPLIRTLQGRIESLTIQSIAAAETWWQASQRNEAALQQSLDDAQRTALEQESKSAEYSQLQQDVASLKKMDDVVGERMKEVDLIRGAGATNITVLNPAELDGAPTPQKSKTLAIAVLLGGMAGLGLACVRDWADERLRTPEAVTATLHAPVLGAIPVIATAFTAADRGQIVHHDPTSDAAESYRTLRTALQYGLPARTKTLLISSPAPGDGKSTVVSNLAIAMAQAGKHVLVVDADFRVPMQHRLFGLKDRIGLASVLDGADRLDDAIQRTEIEGLDVLPCGPVPASPAEKLNDPAFNDYLNELADRYDIVLVDSPPVTAVADARIIAASVDATLLVIRPTVSTRRQAAESRDGLRSVGARLVGVAVNGVPRGSAFATTAAGSYGRGYSVAMPVAAKDRSTNAAERPLTGLKSTPSRA